MRVAAVLGGATRVWYEFATLSRSAEIAAVFAVNDAAACFPGKLDGFVTLHPEKLGEWLARRRAAGYPEPAAVITHEPRPHVTEVRVGTTSGSSGLFATEVALEKTDLPVVLCGVPMSTNRPHFNGAEPWWHGDMFKGAWIAARPRFDRVRSMSGWTAELLGKF